MTLTATGLLQGQLVEKVRVIIVMMRWGEGEQRAKRSPALRTERKKDEKWFNEWQKYRENKGKIRSNEAIAPVPAIPFTNCPREKVFCVSSFEVRSHYLNWGVWGTGMSSAVPQDRATRQTLLKEQTSQSIRSFHWCIQLPGTILR